MAARPLSEDLIDAGHKLLEAADKTGLRPQGAAWLYDHALDEWRYILVSALVDTMGRRKVYQLLVRAFSKLHFPADLTIVDVYLEGPKSPLFDALARFQVVDGIARFENCSLNGMLFDGVIYRWNPTPPPSAVKQIERNFMKKAKRAVEA